MVQNGDVVAGTVTLDSNGQTITFTPDASWQYGAQIQVYLDTTAEDVKRNPINTYQSPPTDSCA